MNKRFWTVPIKGYQYISAMLPAGCRYYPTCSEYAKWSFETSSPHYALIDSTLRILRCNQLFDGGIDYPTISYKNPPISKLFCFQDIKVKYWFVPKIGTKKYFVIKSFDF
jgi:putative membrane protein insertion efficiency factor